MTEANSLAKLSQVMKTKSNKSLLEGALTQGLDMSRFVKCAWIQAQTNKDINALAQSNPTSVFRALLQCAQMGLYPDGVNGEAYLVKFGNECVAIRGYRGLMKLFAQSPQAAALPFVVDVIRENDRWELSLGGKPMLEHTPAKKDRGDITHFYAVARFKDGTEMPKVMSAEEVEAFKGYAKTKKFWDSQDEPIKIAMRLKTVVRQLCKMLPLADGMRLPTAVPEREEAFEAGELSASEYLGATEPNGSTVVTEHIEGGDIKKTEALDSQAEVEKLRADLQALADRTGEPVEPIAYRNEPTQAEKVEKLRAEPAPEDVPVGAVAKLADGTVVRQPATSDDPFTPDMFPE